MSKQRILIVEDNKTLAKLIAKKIQDEVNFEIDIAFNLAEAKLFLKRYNYFLTLLDLNLPDAPNGEIVDYALNLENHVIVLSGNVDKELRKTLLQKHIIDYINKSGINDIVYIIDIIKRLEKNQGHTVLVVDDSMVFRNSMKSMLENLYYNVVTSGNGEEALAVINSNQDVSIVLTDYFMPVMDGLKLTSKIRDSHSKNDICIIAISTNTEEYVNALFLKEGANDYIKKPFSKEEFTCRINNSVESLENIHTITNHANRDYLTGLHNRRYFFNHMKNYLDEIKETNEQFAIAMIDIDDFKVINDTHGHDFGDSVIVDISEILRTNVEHHDIVARFGGEEFCLVLKNIDHDEADIILDRLMKAVQTSTILTKNKEAVNYTVSIGVCMNVDNNIDATIHQADMMLINAKQNGKNKVVFD